MTATLPPGPPTALPALLETTGVTSVDGEPHAGRTAVAAYLARLATSSRRKVLE